MSELVYYQTDPVAFGGEEELALYYPDGLNSRPVPPEDLSAARARYRYSQTQHHGVVYADKHDGSGGGDYIDGKHAEVCTPESPTVEWLPLRMQSHELYAIGLARELLLMPGAPSRVAIHRSVMDSHGNSFGCHDNFAVRNPDRTAVAQKIQKMMIGHSFTRAPLTGSGHASANGLYFAKKLTGTNLVDTYGYVNSVYRVVSDEGTTRVESRCNDVNLCADAVRARLGGMGINISVAQTPLSAWFDKFFDDHIATFPDLRSAATQFNLIPLDEDFNIMYSQELDLASIYTQQLADTYASDKMKRFTDRSPELLAAAEDIYDFAAMMRGIIRGVDHYNSLRARSDWATKLAVHAGRLARDRRQQELHEAANPGVVFERRHAGDRTTIEDDLAYDYIELRRDVDQDGTAYVTVVKKGYGYTVRDKKHAFRTTLDPTAVEDSMLNPPEGGRAALRRDMFRTYIVTSCGWTACNLYARDGSSVTIRMPDVTRATVTPDQQPLLDTAVKRDDLADFLRG